MRLGLKELALLSLPILFWAVLMTPLVRAEPGPDPVEVSWYVTDVSGTPLDGASLTIYWSTSTSGPFTIMPADDGEGTYIYDKIGDVRQNPIYTGYWNPDHPHGMAVCDIHPKGGVSGLYFYVKIDYGALSWYWPVATSYKPGDPTWSPVAANGSPSGYAAEGPGIGTGPTTAYPTSPPRPPVPEFLLATPVATSIGTILLLAAQKALKRRRD